MVSEWTRLTGSGAVLIEGFHAVKHALRFQADLPLMITCNRSLARSLADTLAPDIADTLLARLVDLDPATFDQLVPSGHHTGVAALARPPHWPTADLASADRSAPLVFLDDPRHLGNYGAVVRMAAGLGAAGVVSTGTVDPWHPAVIRGAAGLQFALPVVRVPAFDLDGPLLAFDGGGRDCREATIPSNAVLAFGSERRGLSTALRERADDLLALPMRPGVASYNLAAAVAMALYQWSLSSR